MNASFVVKHERFEGPLDLLLSLIEKRKLLVNDISLAKVADDYIAYINQAGSFPIAESAHFILIASTLVLIKSKSLLPALTLTLEEEASIGDLERRLMLYKRVKELALPLEKRWGTQIIFPRTHTDSVPVFLPEASIERTNILTLVRGVIKSFPKKEALSKAIVRKVISLEDMIMSLSSRIKNSLKMSFKEFSGMGKAEKVNVIVSFLAMLELVKQGSIDVRQDGRLGDIEIESNTLSTPKYS